MQDEQALIEELYQKWINKQASGKEVDELFDLLARVDVNSTLGSLMKARWEQKTEGYEINEERQLEIVRGILDKYPSLEEEVSPPLQGFQFSKIAWFRVASILLCIAILSYFWETGKDTEKFKEVKTNGVKQNIVADVIPGVNKAILTLADGSTILLDTAKNGQLVQQGGASVVKSARGEIIYNPDKSSISQFPAYHTISTPRGGNFRLTLPDGTIVWLNAASSITYPTSFTGHERNVTVMGEVYFEVAKNEKQPFRVQMKNNIHIEVLGTHFNINAYNDEASIQTTLIEGSIKIKNDKGTRVLNPGEQVQIESDGNTILKKNVDLEAVTAWKNNEFHFGEKADFGTVMRQISRWYDIEVEYSGNITGHLGGSISREANISMLLRMLEKAWGVKFNIVGRKIFVTP